MIEVKNLSYAYKGSKEQAVKTLSFSVSAGEIFGFLGPSGAGKSTTQKILIGLLTGYSGEIKVLGKNLKSWESSYYDKIGISFELPNHYLKLTGKENLEYFSTFYNVPVRKAADLLSMVDLKADADKKVESYSKGMKMRLNFVRSLLHSPILLFLDEPTTGLDPVNARNIKDIILNLKREGKTIFLTTHNMYDADELCDRVAFISEGELKIIDSPHQLKLQNGSRTIKVEYMNGTPQLKEFDMDAIGSDGAFLDILKNKKLISIHSEEATLDDVFIRVTGKSLAQNGIRL